MDTKSTKFKYSFFTKGLCIILSAILFFSFAFFGIRTVEGCLVYGFNEYLSGDIRPFYQSYGFEGQLVSDLYYISELRNKNQSDVAVVFDNNRDKIINEALNSYLNEKAMIIHDELLYAVENYDESYFYYEYTADAVDIPEEATVPVNDLSGSEEILTDKTGERIPRNVEAARKVLDTCEGLELLQYSALVRDSAFTENEFIYNTVLSVNADYEVGISLYNSNGYDMDETEIKKHFLSLYEACKANETSSAESQYYYAINRLSGLKSLKYFFIDSDGFIESNDGTVITEDQFRNNAKSSQIYYFSDSSGTSLSELNLNMQENVKSILKQADNIKIGFYIDNDAIKTADDSYAYLYSSYNNMRSSDAVTNITIALVSLIASFILLIAFLCLCGHRHSEEDKQTAYIDKLPTDIHFIISIGIVAGLTALGGWLGIEMIETTSEIHNKLIMIYSPQIISAIFTISYLFFAEWLSSTVRIKKSGHKFFKKMIIAKAAFAIGRICRKIGQSIKGFILTFGYKPKKMQRTVIIIASGYILGNFVIISVTQLLSVIFYGGIAVIAGILFSVFYNCVSIYFILEYLKKLDMIIDASSKHESVDFGNAKLPESLRILSSNLTNTNEALEKAIEKAVRDEQMKTELITNVSHDLKTPLTSLISYSDLLSKCNIEDETASKYISVINNQSIKLKRLIEDLIEASKVSSGNVTINASKLNLSELTMQAIAEFAPEMEKNGNEIRFSEPETPPCVFADGAKTYRILSNLLSNAKKYSAPDTRVYISVYTDSINSYFEIKNISCEPLNISPDELTERFVRGDKSRTKEGNGLGLSIAKDLCLLQNGDLQLFIDGDLFKAIVQLPAKE